MSSITAMTRLSYLRKRAFAESGNDRAFYVTQFWEFLEKARRSKGKPAGRDWKESNKRA